MPKFGYVGPYSEQVKRDHDGKIVDIIPKGNPMEDAGVKTLIRSLNKRKRRPSRRDMRAGMKPYEAKKAPPFSLEDMLKMREYCLKTVEVNNLITITKKCIRNKQVISHIGPFYKHDRHNRFCSRIFHNIRGVHQRGRRHLVDSRIISDTITKSRVQQMEEAGTK
ncbi:uncharacterized protein LOC116605977 isoform X1 [Nematostella vectensis]|uniref:uncharacterized protein LOC116605977 isoform X1 n=1 Tax=Nematostella vectensis TaxID=45351 RepID=UPI0020771E7A|nr:uncharacterized protein LOC116605977 isoform X1 [Nematostella vectensis]